MLLGCVWGLVGMYIERCSVGGMGILIGVECRGVGFGGCDVM